MRIVRTTLGLLLLSATFVQAQSYVISTYAGGAPPRTPVAALTITIAPLGMASDARGSLYFVSSNCVFRLDRNGIVTRVAGNSHVGYFGDGGSALNAQFDGAIGIAIDPVGNLYIADSGNHRVRRVSPDGVITTIAGNGSAGYAGDGGPALEAELNGPSDLATDSSGNLFLVDGLRIRKVSTNGLITTVAGKGTQGFSGDRGPAVAAELNSPAGLAVDGSGSIYIADDGNLRVRKVSPDGIIITAVGIGSYGHSGDLGPANGAQLTGVSAVALDNAGSLFIADSSPLSGYADCYCIRKVSSAGIITTLVPNGNLLLPRKLAVDPDGSLYVAESVYGRIRKISTDGAITTAAGKGSTVEEFGDGLLATAAQLRAPVGLAVDAQGTVYIADTFSHRVRAISPAGIINTVAGNEAGYSGDGGPAAEALLYLPTGVAVDSRGTLYIADHGNRRIRKVSNEGESRTITTVAGMGTNVPVGDVWGVAVDRADNLYIPDTSNHMIRKISPDGVPTVVAGNGTQGYSEDGGIATKTQLRLGDKTTLTTDKNGNLYFVDDSIQPPPPGLMTPVVSTPRVRKLSPDGLISTVAGNGSSGYSGDGGPGTKAQIGFPAALAADNAGNLYLADAINGRIRMVSRDGIIHTIAGTGATGYTGDGDLAVNAQMNGPAGLAADVAGSLYVADQFNNVIRILQPISSGISITGVRNAADNRPGAISPGEIVVLSGSGLGPAKLVSASANADGFFGRQLADTSVEFNGVPAALIYTSSTQMAAVVPYSIQSGTAQIAIVYQHQISASVSVAVAASSPGVFTLDSTGRGQAVAFNQDGAINSPANPAKSGEIVSILATGVGSISPASIDGEIVTTPLPLPILPVTISISGEPLVPVYAGGVAGQIAGVMQIKVRVPDNILKGPYSPVMVQIGSTSSQPDVTIAVQ